MKARIELLEILSEAEDDIKQGRVAPLDKMFKDLKKELKKMMR